MQIVQIDVALCAIDSSIALCKEIEAIVLWI